MKKPGSPSRETAEMLAIQAFAFIAEGPELMAGFLSTTGIEPRAIRDAAREPDFLIGVLEHMLADESLLLAFADSAGLDPAGIARAHSVLSGQGQHELP